VRDDYEDIQWRRAGRVLTLSSNRPDRINAFNAGIRTEAARVFTEATDDPEVDVIVLTGAGRAFSADGDMDWQQVAIDIPNTFEQIVREASAKQYLFTDDRIATDNAVRMGMINDVCDDSALDEVVAAFANRLASGAQKAIQWTKLSVNIGLRDLAAGMGGAPLACESLTNLSADHREGVAAFHEKRKPRWGAGA
jgi:enoyl-CoA hydratase/carnithine racemase